MWQRVDATASGEGLTVLTPVAGGLVGDLEVLGNPFTPNGDGINDVVKFVFPVFKMPGQASLVLEVYASQRIASAPFERSRWRTLLVCRR